MAHWIQAAQLLIKPSSAPDRVREMLRGLALHGGIIPIHSPTTINNHLQPTSDHLEL
jgi:hypothetical protein